jgi:regulator of sirC expression with transglutaminase-like and TPR domain
MEDVKLRALVSLLSDDDREVLMHVEQKILGLGDLAIPYLESEWEQNLSPDVQKRIEELIHQLQYVQLERRLEEWRDSPEQDLLTGMWLVATYQYPDLELSRLRQQLEQIYYETWLELKQDIHPLDQIQIVNDVLFRKHRFSANTKNFHAPANSMLNIVLESKRGNPISLCVIYMLVCQKLKIPVYGVNLPNIFIMMYRNVELNITFYINAFSKGITFSRADIDNYLSNLNLKTQEVYYEPCTNIDLIRRVMRNLAMSFEKTSDTDKVKEVLHLLSLISDGDIDGEIDPELE